MAADTCDFGGSWCSKPTRVYPATSFTFRSPVDGADHTSVGAWFACDACATLIEAGDWEGLHNASLAAVIRSLEAIVPLPEAWHRKLAEHGRLMHDGYRAHATGPGRPITAQDQADADAIQKELQDG